MDNFRICLIGASLKSGNKGVCALAASLIKVIKCVRPNANITLLIGSRSSNPQEVRLLNSNVKMNIVNYRLSPHARLSEHLVWIFIMSFFYKLIPCQYIRGLILRFIPAVKSIEEANVVGDIRGGDSFSDIYGLRRLLIGSIPAIVAINLNKKLVLLPQTYGPYKSKLSQYIARYIMARSTSIVSRDKTGTEIVKKLLDDKASKKAIRFCPDVAFILDSIKPTRIDINPHLRQNMKQWIIGLNINGLIYNGCLKFKIKCNYKTFIHKLITILMNETSAHILLIPHTFAPPFDLDNDPIACKDTMMFFKNSFSKRIHMITREYDQSEIKGIIGLCDFFIGSRMHACIAALSQGIPTIAVAYSRKFKGVFETIGVENMVIDLNSLDTETVLETVLTLLGDYNKLGFNLKNKLYIAEEKIRKTFEEFLVENDS